MERDARDGQRGCIKRAKQRTGVVVFSFCLLFALHSTMYEAKFHTCGSFVSIANKIITFLNKKK